MDAKLNHSDFSALLAKQCNISATKADNFTKAFFDILIEGLESDGIVKINGLGTFKMINVASRGSVNVNTGEKIEIKGHRKLTFLPADSLKDNVNQPFAMFEPVEVDDDYTDDTVEDTMSEESSAPVAEAAPIEETPEEPETKKNPIKTILYTLFIIIALLLLLFFILRDNKSDKKETVSPVVTEKVVRQQAPQPDTIAVASPESETVKEFILVEQMSALPLSQITIKDTTIYRPAGTMAQHRIGLDETLTKISLKYFNDKRLWPYIVHYNNIKDYNKLEIGTELQIPYLVPRN